jgi:hypothetical protein
MSQHGIAGRGLEILAAGAPLQTIVGAVLASQTHSSNWQQASQSACHLIATSKHFQQAVDSCYGVLPVDFGPLASPEAAAAFAGGCNNSNMCSSLHSTAGAAQALLMMPSARSKLRSLPGAVVQQLLLRVVHCMY